MSVQNDETVNVQVFNVSGMSQIQNRWVARLCCRQSTHLLYWAYCIQPLQYSELHVQTQPSHPSW